MIKKTIDSIPSFVLFLILSIVYFGCGYMIGHYQGYKLGQENYYKYVTELLTNNK